MARLDALTCILALISLVSSQFFTPTERQLLRVGEVQKIRYRANSPDYTITIWQAFASGVAKLGPVLVQSTNGLENEEEEFDWLVQLTGFDLEDSNTFFFWLKWGGLENVNVTLVGTISSAYFTITDEPLPSSSASSSTITSSSTSTLSSLLTEVTTSSTASSTAEGNASTASESSGSGLPVAAQAGIGVGVSIAGLAALACGVIWFRYLRKQQRLVAEPPKQLFQPPGVAELENTIPPAELGYTRPLGHATRPAELGHDTRPAELG